MSCLKDVTLLVVFIPKIISIWYTMNKVIRTSLILWLNQYPSSCKEKIPRVLFTLEKQIGGRNSATFTAPRNLLSTSRDNPLSLGGPVESRRN